jgi:hypothetical protein
VATDIADMAVTMQALVQVQQVQQPRTAPDVSRVDAAVDAMSCIQQVVVAQQQQQRPASS